MIQQNALVKFDYETLPKKYHKLYPFIENETYIFLGEIVQMPGHCIVISMTTGQVFTGYHIENFVQLTEDEC